MRNPETSPSCCQRKVTVRVGAGSAASKNTQRPTRIETRCHRRIEVVSEVLRSGSQLCCGQRPVRQETRMVSAGQQAARPSPVLVHISPKLWVEGHCSDS